MKILTKDNFFDSVDRVRELALSLEYTLSSSLDPDPGWRGYRTKVSDDLIGEKILDYVSDFFKLDRSQYVITTFFHITNEDTKMLLDDFTIDKYHKDTSDFAGVIYLTPNPIDNSGTSILDGEYNRIINVENVYNRFVSYPGKYIHAVSNTFGDTKETARLTLNYFVWHIDNPEYIEGVTDQLNQVPSDFQDIQYDDFIGQN